MSELQHNFPFDPSDGYDLDDLLAVQPPPETTGFATFWAERYEEALKVDPEPVLTPSGYAHAGMRVSDLKYCSTGGFPIRSWLLEPVQAQAKRGFVVGHGYGDIESPCFELPCADAVYLVPCFRGLCRSARPPISGNPAWHMLHDSHERDHYILGGCVEDLWTGVSALLQIKPSLEGRIDYMGISFSGGIGALALPWEPRIARGHLNVPTFGHQPLRLRLPTTGSQVPPCRRSPAAMCTSSKPWRTTMPPSRPGISASRCIWPRPGSIRRWRRRGSSPSTTACRARRSCSC